MDDLTSHDDRLPYCDCHACALFERNRLRAELDACETELRTVRTSQAESNAEIERLRAELAECKREKDEALEALSDMVFQFFASASDDMDLLSHSFMSAEDHAISVLIKYGRAKEERRNRYRLIDAAIAGGE